MNPLDRIKQLQADLARVTAEREELYRLWKEAIGGHVLDKLDDYKRFLDGRESKDRDLAALARAESAAPLPMREDPRYRGTDFRSAIDAARKQEGSK